MSDNKILPYIFVTVQTGHTMGETENIHYEVFLKRSVSKFKHFPSRFPHFVDVQNSLGLKLSMDPF